MSARLKQLSVHRPRNLTPDHKHAELSEQMMKHVTSDGPTLRPQQRVRRS